MVRRRFLLVAGVVAAAGLAISSQPVLKAGAQSGGGCQLQGTANFSPSLSNTAQAFSYNFSGSLSSCQSNVAGTPSSGNVAAGNVIPETVTVTTSVGPQQATFNYQEPVPTGNGSCGSSTTSGTGFVVWGDGTRTAFSYATTGAAAAVALQGTVTASVVLQPLPGQGITVNGTFYPAPAYTWTTTRDTSADSSDGVLAFEPPDPTLCNTTGVPTAGIQGEVVIGQA